MTATLEVTDLQQAVCDRPAGDRRRQLCRAGRRDRRAARAVRLRQDHDAALRRRAGTSDRRRDQHRRQGRVVARARHSGAAAAARARHGVSVLCGLAAYDGAAERGLSAQASQDDARRRQPQGRRGAANWSACRNMPNGRWWRCQAARCSASRWRAASSTGRNCCCSTSRLSNLDAKLRLRLRDDLRMHPQADRHDRALRHPRPGRSGRARRPHRRDARRQTAADGYAGRDL